MPRGFLATSLGPETTGVQGAVGRVFVGSPPVIICARPRILVVLGGSLTIDSLVEAVPVRLTTSPEVLGTLPPTVQSQMSNFAMRNRDLLIAYWRGELSTASAIECLVLG